MINRKNLAALLVTLFSAALWTGLFVAQAPARARIINVAAGFPALDVYINGELAETNLTYTEDSAIFDLPAGEAEVAAYIAGTTSRLFLQPVSLDTDASAIVLTSNAGEPAYIVNEDLSPLDFGMTRLTIVNALNDGSAIDIMTSEHDQLTSESLGQGASLGALELPAGQVEFSALPLNAADAARSNFSAALPAAASNILLIHGDSNDPQLLHSAAAFDADSASGRVRFVHAVQGAAPIDLKIDDLMVIPALAFANPTQHIAIPSGSRQLTLSIGGTLIASTSLDIGAGQMRTVVVMGSPASLKPYSYDDSLQDLNESSALVNLVNAVPNSSVKRLRLESGAIVAADVDYGAESGAARIVPGLQSMAMTLEIDDASGTVEVPPSSFYAGSYYNLIALPGSAFTAPRLLVAETSLMRRISGPAPMDDADAQDETDPRATEPEADSEESATEMDSTAERESTVKMEEVSESETISEPDAEPETGPSLVVGPYAIVDLEPSGRLQLRQYPTSSALSLGLLPGKSDLTVLGRRGLSQYFAEESAELPVDLSGYTADPAAALYPAEDLRPDDTWLFVMYQTEDSGTLVGWVNAFYLDVFNETGGTQRLASLPTVRQNRAGNTFNTEIRPPNLADHVSAHVFGLNPDAMLNMRMSNSPDSEVMTQLAPNTALSLVGFDEAAEWAFVDYDPDTGEIMRGWVSAAYLQLLLNGEPVLVSALRALDETIAPQISSQLRGSVRSADHSGPTPIPLSEDKMTGIIGEIVLDPGAMLHLRRRPNTIAESLALIPAGATVAIGGITENTEWLKTSYAERDGWISARYVALLLRGRQYHRDYVESLLAPHDNAGNPSS
ncbi:MAG: DUF4397 domain-containing protein [Chloroflexota bacterium]|nr:DUF4397 domain-containing protein [Chloroflexota bacterium]MDE2909270.1 DUF4397 domain-containing protein [Chloroflexota bacterium]